MAQRELFARIIDLGLEGRGEVIVGEAEEPQPAGRRDEIGEGGREGTE